MKKLGTTLNLAEGHTGVLIIATICENPHMLNVIYMYILVENFTKILEAQMRLQNSVYFRHPCVLLQH